MKCLPDNAIHDLKGKTSVMELAIAALQHEPANPEEGEYLPPGSHWTAATPYGEP